MNISTQHFENLPHRKELQKICKAISVLDAILMQEWQYRYYSYNSKWSVGEEFFEMRDGVGNHLLILFKKEGCVINGTHSDIKFPNIEIVTKHLPKHFHEFIFGQPVKSQGTNFCIWTNENEKWETQIKDKNDGSEELLFIFDGNPETYREWAKNYYENDNIDLAIIKKIYDDEIVTKNIATSLNEEIDFEQLKNDLIEINYPYDFTDR